jgi:hypothetical protein
VLPLQKGAATSNKQKWFARERSKMYLETCAGLPGRERRCMAYERYCALSGCDYHQVQASQLQAGQLRSGAPPTRCAHFTPAGGGRQHAQPIMSPVGSVCSTAKLGVALTSRSQGWSEASTRKSSPNSSNTVPGGAAASLHSLRIWPAAAAKASAVLRAANECEQRGDSCEERSAAEPHLRDARRHACRHA